jgi:hypothetical protein
MTGVEKVGVLLIALGLLYALLCVGWLRRSRKDPPAALSGPRGQVGAATTQDRTP